MYITNIISQLMAQITVLTDDLKHFRLREEEARNSSI